MRYEYLWCPDMGRWQQVLRTERGDLQDQQEKSVKKGNQGSERVQLAVCLHSFKKSSREGEDSEVEAPGITDDLRNSRHVRHSGACAENCRPVLLIDESRQPEDDCGQGSSDAEKHGGRGP